MKVSEVNVHLVKPRDGLVAFASVVLDNRIYLGAIGVHQKLDGSGYRLTYPTRKSGDRSFHIFHPIEKEISHEIERAIFDKLTTLINCHNSAQHLEGGGHAIE
ncbi:MAG: hypothetical protein A2W61_01915 [Deltaproteobacteria bacterium RIFCSPLOWO2_01_44_7]|nr:MAG: hypothetical protein A2712_06405 [Deltaproteobacteria bacterium RIFCSPHIGHO2_01_FULL_43_49]OGQ15987.1 MAG: hypothetical protein A3D22_06265 [Deltaproteobacteria bacterium RIFCSPHIGHO2_02_FULL_44_53]OGQ28944.1 MAG: hypothetical protein A3D98_03850 [Deltaproteobacteria bacterium RIFCSPHIGHO2_12_FULL_44_21]OGQ33185.1 MAG: hypothetical protein A2979_04175 [Deltaproteobacteria bacterium RIFCSPLOWO2_01_FULL_45_74]OGQ42281.1 MAG: hypothetical protein A3I70_06480 [Deltaproteobacteria bacterium 